MLTFDHTIPTSLSPAHVWSLLAQSFLDSSSSALWPDELETLSSDRFAEDAIVSATYKFGPVKMPQRYRLSRCDADSHELIYRTCPGHPLVGGGHVTLTPYGKGCRIHWRGAYAKTFSLASLGAALFTEYYFEQRFFDAIKHNLRPLEHVALHGTGEGRDTRVAEASSTCGQRAS